MLFSINVFVMHLHYLNVFFLSRHIESMRSAHGLSQQIVESALELLQQFNPADSAPLNRSSVLEAYECVKRTLQVRAYSVPCVGCMPQSALLESRILL